MAGKIEYIRRSKVELPSFVRSEQAQRARYPNTLPLDGYSAVVRYRLERPSWVGDYKDAIKRVRFFGWIVAGQESVGALELFTYDPNGCGDNDSFLSFMDADCGFEARMSEMLCSVWPSIVDNVTIWGPILDFRSAWLMPSYAKNGRFAAAANGVINAVLSDHSILLMLAYPLEYQSVVDSPARKRAVSQRQKAMVRHYHRCFGVKPLPGKNTWLWRSNDRCADLIEQPRRYRQVKRFTAKRA